MALVAILFFVAVGIGLIIGRRPLGEFQANIMGGRVPPGCVVAQAAVHF